MNGAVVTRRGAQTVAAAMPIASDYSGSASALLQRRSEVVAGLRDKGRHVLVVCDGAQSQRRCARDLEGSVSSCLGVPSESFAAESADSVIDRFNRLLSACDLSSARAPGGPVPLSHLVIVPDIRALTTPVGLLFVRLIASFPGVGVGLIVLADRACLPICERALDSLARRLTIVELDGSGEPSVVLRQISRAPDAKSLKDTPLPLEAEPQSLRKPDRGPSAAATARPNRSLSARERFDAVDFSKEPELRLSLPHRSGWRKTVGWLAAFASLLLVSALVVVLLHRERTPAGRSKQEDSVRTLVAPAAGRDSSVSGRGR